MDEFGQLQVHRVALTAVAIPHPEVEEPVLYATLAVWADLSPILEEGLAIGAHDGVLPALRTIDGFLLPDRGRMGLMITPKAGGEIEEQYADDFVSDENEGDPAGEDADAAQDSEEEGAPLTVADILDPNFPRFNIVLPTASVALALSMSSVPVGFRIALIHSDAADVPETPEFDVLTPTDLSAFLLIDGQVMHDALCGTVPPALHYPIPYPQPESSENTPYDSMRAILWSTISGVALGQQAAFRKLQSFGEWAHVLATQENPDGERIAAILSTCSIVQMLSMDDLVENDLELNLDVLPGALARLKPLIEAQVSTAALINLADGVPFSLVAQQHGLHEAIPALGVLVSARAHLAAADSRDGSTITWLIGTWMDGEGECEHPWWALPGSFAALAHHDTEVLADLLHTQPEGFSAADSGPMLRRYLHMLAETVLLVDMDTEELDAGLRSLDVTPANMADVVTVAVTLMDEGLASAERENGICPFCEAFEPLMVWEPQRLARAAAALLPCLTDLDAEQSGFIVGEQAWVDYRVDFLSHWLRQTADEAADDDAHADMD